MSYERKPLTRAGGFLDSVTRGGYGADRDFKLSKHTRFGCYLTTFVSYRTSRLNGHEQTLSRPVAEQAATTHPAPGMAHRITRPHHRQEVSIPVNLNTRADLPSSHVGLHPDLQLPAGTSMTSPAQQVCRLRRGPKWKSSLRRTPIGGKPFKEGGQNCVQRGNPEPHRIQKCRLRQSPCRCSNEGEMTWERKHITATDQ